MRATFRIYMVFRLLLVVFFFLYFWLACHFQLTRSSAWLPLEIVALFVLSEELMTALVLRGRYLSGLFVIPGETSLPAAVFEGDRTFVEVLCAVAAAILAIALGDSATSSRLPGQASLTGAVLLCFLYLNLQGGSVNVEKEGTEGHVVGLIPGRSVYLLVLRNFIYWLFLYGLLYTVIRPN